MRTLVIIVLCFAIASGVFVSASAGQPSNVPTQQPLISLDLRDVPLKRVLQELIKSAPADYTLDAALDNPPYSNMMVNLRVQNVTFNDVMESLERTHNLTVTETAAGFVVQPLQGGAPSSRGVPTGSTAQSATKAQSDLVTLNVPRMPVRDAVALVCPGCNWTFGDDLGRTPMPGARFYQFPREMAAATLVTAAGLVSPSGRETLIKNRGAISLDANYQYTPPPANNAFYAQTQNVNALQNRLPANQWGVSGAQTRPEGVALAAYISASGMRFTILANEALDTDLLGRLLTLSGRSYVMGDLSLRPEPPNYKANTADSMNGAAGAPYVAFSRPKAITAQLRNVTLDQALDNLLPACRLTYRKVGLGTNPTYMIETLQAK